MEECLVARGGWYWRGRDVTDWVHFNADLGQPRRRTFPDIFCAPSSLHCYACSSSDDACAIAESNTNSADSNANSDPHAKATRFGTRSDTDADAADSSARFNAEMN